MNNISQIYRNNLCISCGSCAAICPNNAISMRQNWNQTIYIPFVNNNCIKCSLCLTVCPGKRIFFDQTMYNKIPNIKYDVFLNYYLSINSAFSNDIYLRKECSSGGVLTTLLLWLIDEKMIDGAIVTKMKDDGSLEPNVIIANTKEDILAAKGSKYCPVSLNQAIKNINREKKYVIVGLPCHLMGLDYIFKQDPSLINNIKYRFGIFCSRVPNFNATKYLLKKNEFEQKDIKIISYRGNGYPGYFQVELKNGAVNKIYHLSFYYWQYMFAKYFMQYRCWLCPDKTAYYSDISFADDWTVSLEVEKEGRSTLLVRTPIGEELIKRVVKEGIISCNELKKGDVINSQALRKKLNVKTRNRIAKFFLQKTPDCNMDFPKCNKQFIDEFLMFIRINISRIKFKHLVHILDLILIINSFIRKTLIFGRFPRKIIFYFSKWIYTSVRLLRGDLWNIPKRIIRRIRMIKW